jgi:hypothetical protein
MFGMTKAKRLDAINSPHHHAKKAFLSVTIAERNSTVIVIRRELIFLRNSNYIRYSNK